MFSKHHKYIYLVVFLLFIVIACPLLGKLFPLKEGLEDDSTKPLCRAPAPDDTGACCLPANQCSFTYYQNCLNSSGTWMGKQQCDWDMTCPDPITPLSCTPTPPLPPLPPLVNYQYATLLLLMILEHVVKVKDLVGLVQPNITKIVRRMPPQSGWEDNLASV